MKSLILGENLVNGQRGQLTDWNQINWKKARKAVINLRNRIFRAKKLGQWKQLRRQQKLMLRSYANLLLSVRQITQVNNGKQTAGVDKEVATTPSQRVKLVNEWSLSKASPTIRVYIPKSNGKKRLQGIPTLRDRVIQAIVKNLLEPEWSAQFCCQFLRLWKWAKRRHQKRKLKWVKNRYFREIYTKSPLGYVSRKDWVFACESTSLRKDSELRIYDIAGTPIVRHNKVEGTNSPDNPNLKEYWQKRTLKVTKSHWAKGSKYEKVAGTQGYKCPICNDWLHNGEKIETHHIIPVNKGGATLADNLVHLHQPCHKQVHGIKSKSNGLK